MLCLTPPARSRSVWPKKTNNNHKTLMEPIISIIHHMPIKEKTPHITWTTSNYFWFDREGGKPMDKLSHPSKEYVFPWRSRNGCPCNRALYLDLRRFLDRPGTVLKFTLPSPPVLLSFGPNCLPSHQGDRWASRKREREREWDLELAEEDFHRSENRLDKVVVFQELSNFLTKKLETNAAHQKQLIRSRDVLLLKYGFWQALTSELK